MGQLQVAQAELFSGTTISDKVSRLLIQNIFILVRNCEENAHKYARFSQIGVSQPLNLQYMHLFLRNVIPSEGNYNYMSYLGHLMLRSTMLSHLLHDIQNAFNSPICQCIS